MSRTPNRPPQGGPGQQRHGIPVTDATIPDGPDNWPERLAAALAERSRRREVLAATRAELSRRRDRWKSGGYRRRGGENR